MSESKTLIEELIDLLEGIEGDFSQVLKLADYGNNVDRIMGGAKSLAMLAPPDHALHMISDYAALCKAVGYKASQITDNEQFFDVCVAVLLDATETLSTLLSNIHEDGKVLRETIPQAFIERLRWVSSQFSEAYSMSVGTGATPQKLKQSEIDDLLKKLGL
ncbi:hypothetical protein QJS83_10480 [Bdellovibrio sp. 22V]|uniref:hypothetical protein n=1 Tax=Bdellovibrio sp. 22V TaxID=3044166 RepID=UPI002543375D|nr:hypothetical protein [Bdellovibrio sp. 22V]WII70886.1 hypothetical protein QJS83_10480 [Bdellovibrio sp. 22V]